MHRVVFAQVVFAAATQVGFVLTAAACAGKDDSPQMARMNPVEQMSAATVPVSVSPCAAGAAHPNVCCRSGADTLSECSVFPSEPFHPCDPGSTMYPDPTRCCDLADPSRCDEPSAPLLPPPAGRCEYGCMPGWSPSGPIGTSGTCCRTDGTNSCYGWGGPGNGSNATQNPGVTSCDFACPGAWTKLAPAVCCANVADVGALCFSEASGPVIGQPPPPPGESSGAPMPAGVGCNDFGWNGTCECSATIGGTKYSVQCSNGAEVLPGTQGWCTCMAQPGGTTTATLTTALGVVVCPTDGAGYSLAALTDYWENVCGFPR